MKIWKIKACENCPSFSTYHNCRYNYDYCNLTQEIIKKKYELHKECPLEDYKEEDNENNKS